MTSDHARSDPAREVHFGIKTGAFYGQEASPLRKKRCPVGVATMPEGAFYGQDNLVFTLTAKSGSY